LQARRSRASTATRSRRCGTGRSASCSRASTCSPGRARSRTSERHARAREALARVGLEGRLDHKPNQLSGGQQQRVAIARAIVTHPRLLLADEPTGNLDSRTSVEVMALLQELGRDGITVVLVTHEADVAEYASRLVVLRDGLVKSDERRSARTARPTPSAEVLP
jgi:putative ABC transport system ATP-binding protein